MMVKRKRHTSAAPQHRLLVVSNRLPVSVKRDESGQMAAIPSSGGLVSALTPILTLETIIRRVSIFAAGLLFLALVRRRADRPKYPQQGRAMDIGFTVRTATQEWPRLVRKVP